VNQNDIAWGGIDQVQADLFSGAARVHPGHTAFEQFKNADSHSPV
jgi:hypothetical protein